MARQGSCVENTPCHTYAYQIHRNVQCFVRFGAPGNGQVGYLYAKSIICHYTYPHQVHRSVACFARFGVLGKGQARQLCVKYHPRQAPATNATLASLATITGNVHPSGLGESPGHSHAHTRYKRKRLPPSTKVFRQGVQLGGCSCGPASMLRRHSPTSANAIRQRHAASQH